MDGDKRRHPRKNVSLPALLRASGLDDNALLQNALVLDISLGGLQISIPRSYEVGMREARNAVRISITFALPERRKPITIECVPQRVSRSDQETRIGASLVDTDVEMYRTLQNYLMNSIST
jgi:hypothetical protein